MNKRLYFQSLGLLSLLMINGSHVFSSSNRPKFTIHVEPDEEYKQKWAEIEKKANEIKSEKLATQLGIEEAQRYCENSAKAPYLTESNGPEVILNLTEEQAINNRDLNEFKKFIQDSNEINIVLANCGDKRFKQAFDSIQRKLIFNNCIFVDAGNSGNGYYPEAYDKAKISRGFRFCRVKATADEFIKFLSKSGISLDRKVNIIWDDWGIINPNQVKDLEPLLLHGGKIFTASNVLYKYCETWENDVKGAINETLNSIARNSKIRICKADIRRKIERIPDSAIWEDINTWIENWSDRGELEKFRNVINEDTMCEWAKYVGGWVIWLGGTPVVIGAPAGTQRMIEISFNN